MFTGIVAAVGTVGDLSLTDGQGSFRFATGKLPLAGVQLGDSIAVNGCCLTVTQLQCLLLLVSAVLLPGLLLLGKRQRVI